MHVSISQLFSFLNYSFFNSPLKKSGYDFISWSSKPICENILYCSVKCDFYISLLRIVYFNQRKEEGAVTESDSDFFNFFNCCRLIKKTPVKIRNAANNL